MTYIINISRSQSLVQYFIHALLLIYHKADNINDYLIYNFKTLKFKKEAHFNFIAIQIQFKSIHLIGLPIK